MAKRSIHDLQLEIENEQKYLEFLGECRKDCSSDIQRGITEEQITILKHRLRKLKYTLKVRCNATESQPLVYPTLEALDSYETEAMQGITVSPLTKESATKP